MKWLAVKAEGGEQLLFGQKAKGGWVVEQGVFNAGCLHTTPSFQHTVKVMEGKPFAARETFQP